MKQFLPFLFILFTPFLWLIPDDSQTIYFDDSDPDIMVLGNDNYYEIGFRKANGAIAYITDKSTGQDVTAGSRYECLWGAVFSPQAMPQEYVGGCSFNAAWLDQFTYSWSAATQTLTLNYDPNPISSQQVTALVKVVATDNAWFDMHLTLQNAWGYILEYVLFPSDLVFIEDDIQEALLPILPGVVLQPEFFQQDRSYTAKYPGYPGLFADYMSLSSQNGHIAIYSLYGQQPIRPLVMGFVHDDAYIMDSTFYYHTFGAGISDGQTWTSPWVRLHIGRSAPETINAYRIENGLNATTPLTGKLGAQYDQIVQAPLFKADAQQLNIPFSQYSDLLAQVPTPGIFHPVAFQPNGHDESYPDFLPPDTQWGTTNDFAMMLQQAQDKGFLIMPYTNPTWWDDESLTLQSLPPTITITDVAALNEQNVPVYEYYDSHGGYVISPYAPFVQQRLGQLHISMTVNIPNDILFEDQIGARPWLFDYNPATPHPMSYSEGWLGHTQTFSQTILMTELGFDRLVTTEAGFHGSVLLPQHFGYTDAWWGTDTWHPYPLAPMMARDKVLFYQHDLAPETFTTNKSTLSWNMALGYMLSYDLVESSLGGGLQSEWLRLVSVFQKHVLARYAHESVTEFAKMNDQVTRTSFETYTVITNWDETVAYDTGQHILSPLGFQVTSDEGELTAGIFTQYNGLELSPGDHYLIEERGLDEIIVYQPIGSDTSLAIALLPGWDQKDLIEARAYNAAGTLMAKVATTVTEQDVTFVYEQAIAAQEVAYYKIVLQPQNSFIPLLLR